MDGRPSIDPAQMLAGLVGLLVSKINTGEINSFRHIIAIPNDGGIKLNDLNG